MKWTQVLRSGLIGLGILAASTRAVAQPNVVCIAIDDLNDWVGCLGGHPQAQTPNIDRLARRGVVFTNAHCQAPVCNPSRASLWTGLYPETTGIYFLRPPLWQSKVAAAVDVLPERFARRGYRVLAAGKLFHHAGNRRFFRNYAGNFGGFGPFPEQKLAPFEGVKLWDWGAFPERDEQLPDHQVASWAESVLQRPQESPLFLAVGFVTPHVPQYAPQRWLDRFPKPGLQLPRVIAEDLSDLSAYGLALTTKRHIAPTQEWVARHEQWESLVRTYLACVAFVDAQVGRILDAVDARADGENTIVILWSDHGFHLGEKRRWAKRSLWHESTRVPLVVAGPEIPAGGRCDRPVQLIDIYPTLLELAGLEPAEHVEGHSLSPLLRDPDADWPHLARCSFGPGNVALVSDQHRYIRYADGSEELYDRVADPNEWNNRAMLEQSEPVLQAFRERLPELYHAVLGAGATGHRAFDAANQLRK